MLVLRAIFVVILISVVVLTIASNRTSALDFGFSTVIGLMVASVALGLIIITVDALTPNKRLAWVVGIFVGIMLGLVGAVAVGSVIDLVAGAWDLKESSSVYLGLAKVTIGIVLVYLSVSVVLTNVQSTADVAATGGRLAGPIAKGMLDFLLTGPGAQPVAPAPEAGG